VKKPQSIHSILEKTFKTLEIDAPLKAYSVLGAWNKIVGDSVAGHSQPRAIRNQILFIDVAHSTWMQQLQFLKPTLLHQVNAFLGEPLIQDIRFRLAKVSSSLPDAPETGRIEDETLDEETLNRIETLLQNIDEEGVRKGLRIVFIKGAVSERHRRKSK